MAKATGFEPRRVQLWVRNLTDSANSFQERHRHIKCTLKLTPWLPRWPPYCKMTDLHLDQFLDLLQSCTHYYQTRGLVTWSSFSIGFMEILLQDCTGANHQTARRLFFPEFFRLLPIFWLPDCTGKPTSWWQNFFSRKTILFNNIIMQLLHSCIHCDLDNSCSILHKSRDGFRPFFGLPDCTGTLPKSTAAFFRICGFWHFLTTRLHGGKHPDDGRIFSCRKPILFNNIIMRLLHSCTNCDLDYSCSILHKSRDTVTWSSFSMGSEMEYRYKTVRGHITRLHGVTTLRMAAKILVESRSFLIMWANPPLVLLAFCVFPRGIVWHAFCLWILGWECTCCCWRIPKTFSRPKDSM